MSKVGVEPMWALLSRPAANCDAPEGALDLLLSGESVSAIYAQIAMALPQWYLLVH